MYEQRRKERQEQKRVECVREAKCTFRPEINFTSEILVEADPARASETEAERIKRLSRRDAKRQEKVKQISEIEFSSKYTYHPKINETSRTLAKNCSVDELASVERLKTNRAKMLEQAQTKEKEACTFHPQINSSVQANSYYTRDADIMEKIRAHERELAEKREQQKRDAEYEEIKGCTFQPVIQSLEVPPEPAVVRGMGRHMEMQERKKQLEKERREREDQVFGFAQKYDERMAGDLGPRKTIPQPFQLSGVLCFRTNGGRRIRRICRGRNRRPRRGSEVSALFSRRR